VSRTTGFDLRQCIRHGCRGYSSDPTHSKSSATCNRSQIALPSPPGLRARAALERAGTVPRYRSIRSEHHACKNPSSCVRRRQSRFGMTRMQTTLPSVFDKWQALKSCTCQHEHRSVSCDFIADLSGICSCSPPRGSFESCGVRKHFDSNHITVTESTK